MGKVRTIPTIRRRHTCGLAAGAGLLLALAGVWLMPVIAAPASRPQTQPADPDALRRAIAQLSDPRRKVRQEASAAVLNAEPDISLPLLRAAGLKADRHEQQLRIRELAETVFARRFATRAGGFLGIQNRAKTRSFDERVPEGQSWIEVLRVLRDTPAEQAGLRPGDLIVRCDDRTFSDDPTRNEFLEFVASRPPGASLRLEIIRGAEPPFALAARLGHRPLYALAQSDPRLFDRLVSAFEEWWRTGVMPVSLEPLTATRPAP